MDDGTENPNHARKPGGGVWLTHKQLGATAIIGALSITLGQLQNIREFFTGDQAKAFAEFRIEQKENFKELKQLIKDADAENVVRLRYIRDNFATEVAAIENRCEKRVDETKARILNLETLAFKTKRGT